MQKEWFKFQRPIVGDDVLVYNKSRSVFLTFQTGTLLESIIEKLYNDPAYKIFVLLEYQETKNAINFLKIEKMIGSDKRQEFKALDTEFHEASNNKNKG